MAKPKSADAGDIRNCTNLALRKATRALTQAYDQALAPSGVKITQLPILAHVDGAGPITIARLADVLVMDRTTLSRNLRPLARQGWLTLDPGADQRERLVALTAAGRAALARARPLWRAQQQAVHKALGGKTWNRLMADLDAVLTAATAPPNPP